MFGKKYKKENEYREERQEHEYKYGKHPRNILGGHTPNPYAQLGGTQGKITSIAKKARGKK